MKDNPGKIVTKYQFSGLLKQAWDKTMTLARIMAAFWKCGIYPLNPNAIDCSISVSNPEATLESLVVAAARILKMRMEKMTKETQNNINCFKFGLMKATTCLTELILSGFVFIIQSPYQRILCLTADKIICQVIFIH